LPSSLVSVAKLKDCRTTPLRWGGDVARSDSGRVATAVAQQRRSRSATGVVRLAVISLLIGFSATVLTTPPRLVAA
jgi:hypothetical protein